MRALRHHRRHGTRATRAALLAGAILVAGATAAGAATVTLSTGLLAASSKTLTHATCTVTPATTDITIDEAHQTTNNNSSSLTTQAPSPSRKRALISFDLSGCGSSFSNAEVDSATLSLRVTSTSSGRSLKVYRVTSSWSGTTTWSSQPSYASASTATFTPAVNTTASIDVTQDVNDFAQSAPSPLPPYSSTVPDYGWMIADEGSTTGIVTMNSSTASSNKPSLVIAYAY